MPITKCEASKATPAKGLAYIFDEKKTLARGSQGFMTDDPEQMAKQMMDTMHLHGKGWDKAERKYYHTKVSFDPKDLKDNGGILDEHLANTYAAGYAAKIWPGREVAWSVQHHGKAMHIHFISAACHQETGKKLDARAAEYRKWKDQAQELAEKFGLSTLDWRKATRAKRGRENQSDRPVEETFAEQGRISRGKTTWKDDLRSIIDEAASSCRSMDELRAFLQSKGVTLTRCTDTTISYKLGDHKACRGDTLGGDYTAEAIYDAIEHNQQYSADAPRENERKASLGSQISNAGAIARGENRPVGADRRKQARALGRLAGMTRMEVDAMCDYAPRATWAEKQAVWDDYKVAKAEFWDTYNEEIQRIQDELDDAYERRRQLRKYEWVLDPRNQHYSFIGGIIALIYILTHDTSFVTDMEIARLREQQQKLRQEAAVFRSGSKKALETLREKGLALDVYMESVKEMQEKVEQIHLDARPRSREIRPKSHDSAER